MGKGFKTNNQLNAKSLLHFHETTETKNIEYGVIMDRGFVKTTSITQIEKTGQSIEMRFKNLQNNVASTKVFELSLNVNN